MIAVPKWLEKAYIWSIKSQLWRCANSLIAMGQNNGEAQKHINAAKDEIYKAIDILNENKRKTTIDDV